jgi:hypothetical protein
MSEGISRRRFFRMAVAGAAAAIAGTIATPMPAQAALPPHVMIGKWRIQFRADRPHSLGGCVSQPVSHFHVELFQLIGSGRWKYLSNFHVGSYRSTGRCFVIWNNYRPALCLRSCGGRGGLERILKSALILAAAAAGVTLAAGLAAVLARSAAGSLYLALP